MMDLRRNMLRSSKFDSCLCTCPWSSAPACDKPPICCRTPPPSQGTSLKLLTTIPSGQSHTPWSRTLVKQSRRFSETTSSRRKTSTSSNMQSLIGSWNASWRTSTPRKSPRSKGPGRIGLPGIRPSGTRLNVVGDQMVGDHCIPRERLHLSRRAPRTSLRNVRGGVVAGGIARPSLKSSAGGAKRSSRTEEDPPLRKRLALLIASLTAAALLLPAAPAAATKCAIDDVVVDTARCTRLHVCWEFGICV
jgi:hypothetical protein